MPLYRRVPKSGFKNINRIEYVAVNLFTLERLATEKGLTEITPEVLVDCGVVSKKELVKILAKGELNACISGSNALILSTMP